MPVFSDNSITQWGHRVIFALAAMFAAASRRATSYRIQHGRFLNSDQFELPIGINKQRDGSTEVKIGGQSGQKLAQLAQVLPLQLIHPEGFDLLTDGPKHRRAFIDWGVFHTEPAFYDA